MENHPPRLGDSCRYSATDVSDDKDSPIELWVRLSHLVTGIVCAIWFAVIGTVSVVVTAWNTDGSFPHPIPMAVFFGVFWGAWFLLSLYIIAARCREKLTVTAGSITQAGVFLTRTTPVSNITTAKWRAWPVGGSLVIRSRHSRIKIEFNNFLADEREQLVATLRELIPKDCQTNWDTFATLQQAAPTRPEKLRSTAILCMAMFFIIAAVCVYSWHIRFGIQFLYAGVACSLVGLWYLFRIMKFVPDSDSAGTA